MTKVVEIPPPALLPGHVLIHTVCSLISPGTERMLREFGKASLVGKVLQQPQRVQEVLQKIRTDGLTTTLEAVQSKLGQPTAVGYCNVGKVVAVAPDVSNFSVGDRVLSNGPHAEIVRVSKNLIVHVPDAVSDDEAVFGVLASIALQGIRLAAPALGECVVVTGLGLVGLLTVQLLRAQGVRVLGIDPNAERCAFARQSGAEAVCLSEGSDPIAQVAKLSRGRGADAVLICAATKSDEPIEQAAQMARSRARIVLVGVVGLQIPRDEFYRKELTFQVSCSYGPGRYDPFYEEKGQDYPIGYVRWTAQRNFEAVLDMMADSRLDTKAYVSCRFPIEQAARAYERLDAGGGTLGIVLDYPQAARSVEKPVVVRQAPTKSHAQRAPIGKVRIAAIGAGNYASRQLIPAFVKAGASLKVICANSGISSDHIARRFGNVRLTSNVADVFGASDADIALIATRHDSHAELVVRALQTGKAAFVEKPLALTEQQVGDIKAAYEGASAPFLMVGFNRRFSQFVVRLKRAISMAAAPPAIVLTMNAGAIPATHWTQDIAIGGGRIIGEACHFIDLARHLAGATIVWADAVALGNASGRAAPDDNALISLKFANGAVASIQYLANGHKSFPKERIDVFCDGKTWQIDNFRQLTGYGAPGQRSGFLDTQDKGQAAMATAVIEALRNGTPAPIPVDELLEVALVTIALDRRLRRL